jgi:hypothetical protein
MANLTTIPPRRALAIAGPTALLATAALAQGHTIVCEYRYQLARMLQLPGNGQPANLQFRLPAAYWVPLDAICDPVSRTLYWADGSGSNRILRANLDGTGLTTVLSAAGPVRGPALDGQGYLYYVDGNTLCRATTNGTAVQVLFTAQQTWPIGCPLVDATNGHVYVGADNSILRFDLAGGNARTVVTGLGFPRALALDIARSQIFWIDAQPATDHIGRARLDGSDPTVLFDNSPTAVQSSGLTQFVHDPASGAFLFADDLTDTVSRVDRTGGNVTLVHSSAPNFSPAGIALLGGQPVQPIADCNRNGIADALDIANSTSLDCNANGFPDECEARPCPNRTFFLDHGSNPNVPGRALGCAGPQPNACFEVFQPFDVPSPGAALGEIGLDGWTANYAAGGGFTVTLFPDDGSSQAANEAQPLHAVVHQVRFDPDHVNWSYAPFSVALRPGRYWLRCTGNGTAYQAGLNVGTGGGLGSRSRTGVGTWFTGAPIALRLTTAPLAASHQTVSLSGTGRVDFVLDAGPAHAQQVHWLLGSISGTSPGLVLGPALELPLLADAYTVFTAQQPNTLPLLGGLGTLDGAGMAVASFQLPPGLPAGLAGLVVRHAFFALSAANVATFASPAVAVVITP